MWDEQTNTQTPTHFLYRWVYHISILLKTIAINVWCSFCGNFIWIGNRYCMNALCYSGWYLIVLMMGNICLKLLIIVCTCYKSSLFRSIWCAFGLWTPSLGEYMMQREKYIASRPITRQKCPSCCCFSNKIFFYKNKHKQKLAYHRFTNRYHNTYKSNKVNKIDALFIIWNTSTHVMTQIYR